VQCGLRDNTNAVEKNLLKLWKLQEIAAIAMLDEDDASQAPIGSLLLLKEQGHIDERTFVAVEQLISAFYKPLRQALELHFLRERSNRVEAAGSRPSRLRQFEVAMNNAASFEPICHVFATELFRQYAFDGLGYFVLDNDVLVNRQVETADPCYFNVVNAWESYLRKHSYRLDVTDGGISHAFLKNLPLMFHDMRTIADLPMSKKDREGLAILKTVRTILLVPVRLLREPIGVLAFFSLVDPVNISESDLSVISALTNSFATALLNCDGGPPARNRLLN
jgi:GAF domain-containing protein